MKKTNIGLVEFVKSKLGDPYWYGCFGQIGSASLLNAKINQYPDYYTKSRIDRCRKQYGKQVFDCVGLIKAYLWQNAEGKIVYNANQDVSANGMLEKCKEKGKIATLPEIKGVLLFMKGHVGVYIGGGYAIEATVGNSDYKVKKSKVAGRGWTNWGKCPYIDYETEKPVKTPEKPAKTTPENKYSNGAEKFDSAYKNGKQFTVSAASALWLRKAAVNGATIIAMPHGAKVMWYGYYTEKNGVIWRYVQYKHNGKTYTGFCSGKYLK